MIKKIFLSLFFFVSVFSAPVGNPSLPAIVEEGFFIPDTKWVSLRLGYQNYYSDDLVMKFDDLSMENGFRLRKMQAFANLGTVTLNVKERLDLYSEIGAAWLETEFRNVANLYKSKSTENFLYRAGAKLILFEILDFTLAADVKYSLFSAGSASFFTQNDTPVNGDMKFNLKEWQIGIGLAQKITVLRPYAGVAYRDTQIEMENSFFPRKFNLTFQKKVGAFVGTAASLGSFVMLNGEIRFINERSTSVSGEIRF